MVSDNVCPGRYRWIQKTLRRAALKHQGFIFRSDYINTAFIVKKEAYYGNCYPVKIIEGGKFLGQIKEGKDGHCLLGPKLIGSVILLLLP